MFQGLHAPVFVFPGDKKLITPMDDMMAQMPLPLPAWFIYFIGVVEILGALGLVLPGITHIRPGLTPLGALGLVLVTIGAAVYQLAAGQPGNAVFALVVGVITAFVGYGRWRLVPVRRAARPA